MKLKRFLTVRPEIEIEIIRPILGRLVALYCAFKCCRMVTVNPVVNFLGNEIKIGSIIVICIPKIKVKAYEKD